MTDVPKPSHIARPAGGDPASVDRDTLRDVLADQRQRMQQLAQETAALRQQAADLLSRSRWWRDECRRELLRRRRWHQARAVPPGHPLGQDDR